MSYWIDASTLPCLLQNAFMMYDRDRSGYLSGDEVFQGLTYAGYRFDQPSFQALLRTFDPDRNGKPKLATYMDQWALLQVHQGAGRHWLAGSREDLPVYALTAGALLTI